MTSSAWPRTQNTAIYSPEWNTSANLTNLRDLQVAQRYTVRGDSVADGLAGFWTQSVTGSASISVSSGEGLLQTGTTAGSIAQLVSDTPPYLPGQVNWLNSAIRFGDLGSAGTTMRIGVCTVSGTTPQDGFFYELNDTTFNAVTVKAGVRTVVASGSWTRAGTDPFTLTTSYTQLEIRYTANTAWFLVNNILRHLQSGGTTGLTSTLNFPMFLQIQNTAGGTNRTLAVRNIGVGRFGTPQFVNPAQQQQRVLFAVNFTSTNAPVADTLITTLAVNRGGTETTGVTSISVTAGKTLRITTIVLGLRSTTAATPYGVLTLRMNPTGAAIITSPVVSYFKVAGQSSGIGASGNTSFGLGDSGLEFSGTNQIALSFSNNTNTNVTNVTLLGYEYFTPA